MKEIKLLQPIDILVVNGDAIDGPGLRNKGIELLTTNRNEQVDIAVEAIQHIKAKDHYFTYGTGYHTGPEEDWEDQIAARFGTKPYDVLPLDINGLIFDIRHQIGSSQTPIGRFTALSRAQAWNALWSVIKDEILADVIIRSHVHYFGSASNSLGLMMTTPALQGPGTNFGARQMDGIVDFGFVHFDVVDREDYSWFPHILDIAPKRGLIVTA